MKICSIKGCNKKYRSKGLCNNHYMRLWKTGSTNLKDKSPFTRMMNKVIKRKNGCWEFTGTKYKRGYGILYIKKRKVRASRFSYEHFFGKFPKEKNVCHHCDNPSCVNPNHLFLGTQKENMQDCSRKGRTLKGESSPTSKLKLKEVLKIKSFKNKRGIDLAKIYKVSPSTISAIRKERLWKHV